jgi:hypothetical protein
MSHRDYRRRGMRNGLPEVLCRHALRVDPIAEPVERTFAQLNETMYQPMEGPSQMLITDNHRDHDLTDRLDG